MSLATGTAADAFVPSEEEQRIRETVATIASRYGRAYMRRCIEEERPPVQLWDEVASTRASASVRRPDDPVAWRQRGGARVWPAERWWGVRPAKIAAVSREMILNYVAEHSLRLPRS